MWTIMLIGVLVEWVCRTDHAFSLLLHVPLPQRSMWIMLLIGVLVKWVCHNMDLVAHLLLLKMSMWIMLLIGVLVVLANLSVIYTLLALSQLTCRKLMSIIIIMQHIIIIKSNVSSKIYINFITCMFSLVSLAHSIGNHRLATFNQ